MLYQDLACLVLFNLPVNPCDDDSRGVKAHLSGPSSAEVKHRVELYLYTP